MLSLASGIGTGREMPVRLDHVTLRGVESIVRVRTAGNTKSTPRIAITSDNSVFHFQGKAAAMFQILGDRNPAELARPVTMTGDGSLANEGVRVTAWIKPGAAAIEFPELENIEVEGLTAPSFEFAGKPTLAVASSMLNPRSYPMSRRTVRLPGVDAEALLKRAAFDDAEMQPEAERAEGPALVSPQ
jgi:hypothetical protein